MIHMPYQFSLPFVCHYAASAASAPGALALLGSQAGFQLFEQCTGSSRQHGRATAIPWSVMMDVGRWIGTSMAAYEHGCFIHSFSGACHAVLLWQTIVGPSSQALARDETHWQSTDTRQSSGTTLRCQTRTHVEVWDGRQDTPIYSRGTPTQYTTLLGYRGWIFCTRHPPNQLIWPAAKSRQQQEQDRADDVETGLRRGRPPGPCPDAACAPARCAVL